MQGALAAVAFSSGGFSLLELMVVLVIMGLLGALVGPKLFKTLDTAKIHTAEE